MLLALDMQPQTNQQPVKTESSSNPAPANSNKPDAPASNNNKEQSVFPSLDELQNSFYAQQPPPTNQYPNYMQRQQSYPPTVVYNAQPPSINIAPNQMQRATSYVQPNMNMLPNQNYQQMVPSVTCTPIARTGANVLLTPDQAYFAPNALANRASPFPLYQAPKGNPVEVKVEMKKEDVKQRNTAIGLGVGAGAMVLTGGLALPVVAGVVAYNLLKNDSCAKYRAYLNTYVYELRAAIARDLNVRPEFVLLNRNNVSLDDNEMIQKYMSALDGVKFTASILNVPVVGSNYHLANGGMYPPVQSVVLLKPFKKYGVC